MRGRGRAHRFRDARRFARARALNAARSCPRRRSGRSSFARMRGSRVTLASARHCAGLRPVPSRPAVTWGAQSAHPCARCACAASLPRTPRYARGLIHVTAAAARLVATAAARATREPRTRAKHLTAPARLARMRSFLNPRRRLTPDRAEASRVLPETVGAQGCAPTSPRDGLPACLGKDPRRLGVVRPLGPRE